MQIMPITAHQMHINPANPQDLSNRANPQDLTQPTGRNPQDARDRAPGVPNIIAPERSR